ncbi:ExeM/NucH family extracellular endonuclease [Nocardioides sp. LML1-1-1.1]|uniref:ExeM/NucH family extracellular endonuclease n=1 Tax=Nocardioides sp. LML1-1-1.1 TaxID=3135248 RepID=UPI00344499EE
MRSAKQLMLGSLGTALALSGLTALAPTPSAQANTGGTGLVISEVYGAGGNGGAAYNADFVELYNPTNGALSLSGLAIHYRSASGGSGGAPVALSGSVPAKGHYLIRMGAVGTTGAALPTPDAAPGSFSMAAAGGQVALQQGTAVIATSGNTSGNASFVDFVGASGSTSFETAATTSAATAAKSLNRTNGADSDSNAADFVLADPTPTNASVVVSDDLAATDPGDKTFVKDAAISPITLSATGGTAPYTWSTTALPAGLDLNGSTIEGTPSATGTTTVTATVTDATSPTAVTATTEFTITVNDPAATTTIADIQGSGATSPVVNTAVTTQGVVTAAYPTGGFNGFYIQTPGPDTTPGRSDGIFVFGSVPAGLAVGDSVRVSGTVKEFNGLTEIDVATGSVTTIAALGTVVPKTVLPGTDCALPGTDCLEGAALEAAREAVEGEAFKPTAPYTVTDAYDGSAFVSGATPSSSNFGEIGLAAQSDQPLITPTDIIDAQDTAAIAARTRWNDAHRVILDDGSSTTYWNTGNTAAGKDSPLPWFTADHQVRVGAKVTFDQPVILDYRFGWKVQPTGQVVGAPTGKLTFEQNRPAAPAPVGGDIKLGTFNVLNYFTTLGKDYAGCTSYKDRAGNPIAVNTCPGTGPRGAWDETNFQRQQAKIVGAINKIDADIISVEEIENSRVVDGAGADRDEALAALVTALNAAAGAGTWDYVRSPASASTDTNVALQDVIRTGFIYKPAAVEVVGDADMLFGTTEFDNAREPFASVFKPKGATDASRFAVIVNHFKSKGSGANDGTGQGNANPDRINQATRLAKYADDFAAARGVSAVFLTGDFNSYSQEDPMQVLYGKGFSQLEAEGKHSYSFDGQSGSLDHVLANDAAKALVTGVDIWEINANETVFNLYSRYNYAGTNLYTTGTYSASDHNPEVIGIKKAAPTSTDVQIIGTNDFHGRLLADGANAAGASVLSGAVKKLRSENPDTVFVAAGDLIGASTFESFIQKDAPTIDALNEAGLEVSAAGNHEFDQGYEDLVGRVKDRADWTYIAANVNEPDGRDDLADTWVKDIDGVKVGFVGAVTEDLPTLVSPSGIEGLTVTDIVDATNAAAARLKAGGADLVVLLVHEGSASTTCTSSQFTDPTTVWGNITQNVSPDVDAIVSGHTHLAYNCSFPVAQWQTEGRAVTERPVVSAGQYGTNLNKLVFTVGSDGKVTAKTQEVLSLTTGTWPTDPAVTSIVNAASAQADVLGAKELGTLQGVFNRAKLSGGTTENRGGESTLGNKVAEVQRWATDAQIAFMNPGGLRQDMGGTVVDQAYLDAHPDSTAKIGDRILTYKQAAVVQPFANTLNNVKLTGAQLKTVLEQQWQRAANGTVPTRPFLRLGVSDGFTYTYSEKPVTISGVATFQGTVTGMWLDGEPIDLTKSYSVTVNSFLATGGDNFREFANGTGKVDTGKADLQAMVDYMAAKAAQTPLPVDKTQHAVQVDFPADAPASYAPGSHVTFSVGSWAMSTAADAKDATLQVKLGDEVLGSFPVDNTIGAEVYDPYGKASVDVTLPAGLPSGAIQLTLVGPTTGTTAIVPVTVKATLASTGKPTISGTPKVGEELTSTNGGWEPTPTSYAYQWLADGAEISGATASTFTPGADQEGKVITLRVTASLDGWNDGTATSEPTAEVAQGTFANTAAPTISGTPAVGQKLSASSGGWDPAPDEVTYQWYADEVAISGATDASYTLTAAELGTTITVVATATAAGFEAKDATSEATAAVAKGTPVVTAGNATMTYGKSVTVPVFVTATGASTAGGTVTLRIGTKVLGTATVDATGRANVVVAARSLVPGLSPFTFLATYSGNASLGAGSDTGVIVVRKGTVTVTKMAMTSPVKVKSTRAVVNVRVANADGVPATGTVTVSATGVGSVTVTLVDGRASAKLPVFPTTGTKTLALVYNGNAFLEVKRVTSTFTVVR